MNISIIGTIYNDDAVLDTDGNIVTPATAIPGYHVNTTALPESLAQYEINPATPMRVFGGHVTYCLKFADEAEFKTAMAQWLPEPDPIEGAPA